jgi:hypothetical protein
VVDISTVANEAIASVKPPPELLAVFLPEYRKRVLLVSCGGYGKATLL